MKTFAKFGLSALFLIALLYSCKQSEAPEESSADLAIQSTDSISSLAAVEKKEEPRKFIRTADLKFKVKNVAKSTYAIENATNKFGGFVTYTNLQSTINNKIETKISQDSILETLKYSVENNITIRVPNTKLDTVIKTIAKQIDYLDYRVIKADDVSLQMLSNELAQKRNTNNEKRIEKAIEIKGKKLNDVITAESNLVTKREQNDNHKLENLSLQDQVNFSTITLLLYQSETIKQETIANKKDKYAYQTNFGLQILDALKSGWFVLQSIIVFLFQLWWFILLISIGFFVYKNRIQKENTK